MPIHRFQLHLVRKRPLAWQDVFTLQVAVAHENRGGVVVHLSDDERHGGESGEFAGVLATVSRDNLVAAFRKWAGDAGREYAIFLDALDRARHGFVVADTERVILEWVQLLERQLDDLLALLGPMVVGRLKQVIVRCQT